ncbi:transglycosylase SLT domain-containing protein [Nonomuraea sp. MCN248]|uniref:Transglycosylase SLT domain-containing protein n=1 Tax=Nonomuraea corallina TaxID=2989783 RepID=A0ABT4SCA0_9ACTN|nr:transglycosylase SLT domain-containing protein [Nonomuraea corallina]MDA0634828.1 transglycosylase SLT domain-containing protein [Nonomuraea corallina]
MRSLRVVTAAAVVAALAGCATRESPVGEGAVRESPARESAAPAPSPAEATAPVPDLPDPGEPIPKDPAKLALALEKTTGALAVAIDGWDKKQAPPREVELLALHHQRIHRFAARNPEIAAKAFARLPRRLGAQARDNTRAIRELLALAHPVKSASVIRTRDARPAAELLRYFKQAERRFGVEWEVLAAVMFAETKFGRVRSASHVGAQGPMQFMPATWKAYGMGGDVQDHRDSVMAAANYLRATGAPGDYRRALHAYNPSQAYVNAIQLHARQIKRDPVNYYVYYNWQVYVITTKGERRVTGPS